MGRFSFLVAIVLLCLSLVWFGKLGVSLACITPTHLNTLAMHRSRTPTAHWQRPASVQGLWSTQKWIRVDRFIVRKIGRSGCRPPILRPHASAGREFSLLPLPGSLENWPKSPTSIPRKSRYRGAFEVALFPRPGSAFASLFFTRVRWPAAWPYP